MVIRESIYAFDAPSSSREPQHKLYRQKRRVYGVHFAGDSVGLSKYTFGVWWAP